MSDTISRTATIRHHAKKRDGVAEAMLADLLHDLFQLEAGNVAINHDQYSLNSLNGFFDSGEQHYFFKFHQEEGEEAMSGEYYRADIVARAGLPVEQPLMMSALPGEQILVYKRRSDPRFSDVLRALDTEQDADGAEQAVAAEARLNATVLSVYLETLHEVTEAEVAGEPVHRLFHDRLITAPAATYPGGRLASFYVDREFAFPGVTLGWDAFSTARFVINGVEYGRTVGELFDAAHARLAPALLADGGGVTAHGDAHNANVWYHHNGEQAELSFFDPAFAGAHIPTLLAEVKTTFHNILAHPFWLYDPAIAEQTFQATARYEDGKLFADFDWRLSPIRQSLLDVKALSMWRPLLSTLKAKDMLPSDWRTVVRLGLFLCPTLVMNLRAGATTHNPTSSLIGFSVAVMTGSEPIVGEDMLTRFFEMIEPERS
jgi:Ser/Thr protein kinase RdoA (MazF antagonist)